MLLLLLLSLIPSIFGARPIFLARDTTPTGSLAIDLDSEYIAPLSLAVPRSVYKQTSRQAIVARIKAREAQRKIGARQAQTSQLVYPTCDPSRSGYAPIEGSGFANLSPYYITRTAPYDVAGSWRNVRSALECIALCQQVGASCTGVYWDATPMTCSRRTSGIPPGSTFASRTGGVMAIRGTCAEIAARVNNPTVMSNCCDSPPPPSNICTDTTFRNLGQNCIRSRIQLANNQVATSGTRNVPATTAQAGYAACNSACQSASAAAYTGQTANAQCLGVMYDHTRSLNPAVNCYLQGGNLPAMTVTTNTQTVTIMAGRCEQQNAGTGTYPAAYRNTPGCNSEAQIPAT